MRGSTFRYPVEGLLLLSCARREREARPVLEEAPTGPLAAGRGGAVEEDERGADEVQQTAGKER